jgi:hypothetical protein
VACGTPTTRCRPPDLGAGSDSLLQVLDLYHTLLDSGERQYSRVLKKYSTPLSRMKNKRFDPALKNGKKLMPV